MPKIVLPQKDPLATVQIVFDFASYLGSSETISSSSCTCTVYSGTDASPSAVLSGSTSNSGTQVTQMVTGGVNGVTYILACTVITSLSQHIVMTGYLTILSVPV